MVKFTQFKNILRDNLVLFATISIFLVYLSREFKINRCNSYIVGNYGDATTGTVWWLWATSGKYNKFAVNPWSQKHYLANFPMGENFSSIIDFTQVALRAPMWALSKMFNPICVNNTQVMVGFFLTFVVCLLILNQISRNNVVNVVITSSFIFSQSLFSYFTDHPTYIHFWIPLLSIFFYFKYIKLKRIKHLVFAVLSLILAATTDVYFLFMSIIIHLAFAFSFLIFFQGSKKSKILVISAVVSTSMLYFYIIEKVSIKNIISARSIADFKGFSANILDLVTLDPNSYLSKILNQFGIHQAQNSNIIIKGSDSYHWQVGSLITLLLLISIYFLRKSLFSQLQKSIDYTLLRFVVFIILFAVLLSSSLTLPVIELDFAQEFFELNKVWRTTSRIWTLTLFCNLILIKILLVHIKSSNPFQNFKSVSSILLIPLTFNLSGLEIPKFSLEEKKIPTVYQWVKKNTKENTVLAINIPTNQPATEHSWQVFHGRRLANPFFNLSNYSSLSAGLSPLDPQSACILNSHNVELLIIRNFDSNQVKELQTNLNQAFKLVGLFESSKETFDIILKIQQAKKAKHFISLEGIYYTDKPNLYSGLWIGSDKIKLRINSFKSNQKNSRVFVTFGVSSFFDNQLIVEKEGKVIHSFSVEREINEITMDLKTNTDFTIYTKYQQQPSKSLVGSNDNRFLGAYISSLRVKDCN
jgi:hypothetical protein